MALIISLLVMALYAIAISVGVGRRLDDDIRTRWVIVAGGVFIVVGGKTWGDWQALQEWLVFFGTCSLPLILRAALFNDWMAGLAAIRQYHIPEERTDGRTKEMA